jgi:hypothetical protein
MRNYVLLLAGVCLVQPGIAHAQAAATGKPQAPVQGTVQPATPANERKEIKLSEKVLTMYVGEYQMDAERTLTVTLESGYLYGQPTGQGKRQLFPESQTNFFLKDIDAQLAFQKDAKGKVIGAVMNQAGRPQRELKKVK